MQFVATKDLGALRAGARLRLDAVMAARRRAAAGDNADVHAAKLAEARAIGETPTPLLDAEAELTGVSAATLALVIIGKSAAGAAVVAAIEAQRQAAQAAIAHAATPAAIEAVIQAIENDT